MFNFSPALKKIKSQINYVLSLHVNVKYLINTFFFENTHQKSVVKKKLLFYWGRISFLSLVVNQQLGQRLLVRVINPKRENSDLFLHYSILSNSVWEQGPRPQHSKYLSTRNQFTSSLFVSTSLPPTPFLSSSLGIRGTMGDSAPPELLKRRPQLTRLHSPRSHQPPLIAPLQPSFHGPFYPPRSFFHPLPFIPHIPTSLPPSTHFRFLNLDEKKHVI